MPTFFETRKYLLSWNTYGTWPFLGWRQTLARRKKAMSEILEVQFCYLRDKKTSVAEVGKETRRHNESGADCGGPSQHIEPLPSLEGDRTPKGRQLSGPRDGAGGAVWMENVLLSPESCVRSGHPRGDGGVPQSGGSVPLPSGTSCMGGRLAQRRGGYTTCPTGLL